MDKPKLKVRLEYWECAAGHVSAHSPEEFTDSIVKPRCPIKLKEFSYYGIICLQPLKKIVKVELC
jgi:hypothetical protein